MNLIPHLPVLQVVVPLLCAPLVVLLRNSGLAWAATTAASVTAFAIAINLAVVVVSGGNPTYAVGSWEAPYGIGLSVDAFSAILLLIVSGASTVALIGAKNSIDVQIDKSRQSYFYAAWLLVLAGLAGIVVAADAFNIFVFMEISSLASYVLIAGSRDRRALPSVFKYLIMGTIGATFYLIGVGLIYMMTGTLSLADMELRIQGVSDQSPVLVAAGFITVGLALKAAVFPLHLWLPNAYTYAPHMVTVFLAACSTKVVLYVLLRFNFAVFQGNLTDQDLHFSFFLMPLAVLGILLASTAAIFEKNLKRLLAYSSIAQIGYILLGASLVSKAGLSAGIIHMFNHALAKGTLFLAVACLAMRFYSLRLYNLAGAARDMPWVTAMLVVGGLSMIGIPGTAGFVSKWYLISAVLQEGTLGIILAGVIVLSSLMAVVYIWRIVEAIYFQKGHSPLIQNREVPVLLLVMTGCAAFANIYFGLSSGLITSLAATSADILLQNSP